MARCETWSYAELADAVARIAGGLAARGIGAGDRVLIHCENCPETVLARFACAWLGATALLSNAHLAAPELARIVAALRPRGAITQPKPRRTGDAGGRRPRVDRVHGDRHRRRTWRAITAAQADRFSRLYGEPLPRRAPDPTAPAMILFTTGSTSRAEGGAVDARQSAVGRQGRRAAARAARRRHLSGAPAAVSRRRLYLVVHAGVLGRRHCRVAAEIFSKPVLAGGAGASGDRRLACRDRRIPARHAGAGAFIPAMAVRPARPGARRLFPPRWRAPAGA